jgi:hypothetical protein
MPQSVLRDGPHARGDHGPPTGRKFSQERGGARDVQHAGRLARLVLRECRHFHSDASVVEVRCGAPHGPDCAPAVRRQSPSWGQLQRVKCGIVCTSLLGDGLITRRS